MFINAISMALGNVSSQYLGTFSPNVMSGADEEAQDEECPPDGDGDGSSSPHPLPPLPDIVFGVAAATIVGIKYYDGVVSDGERVSLNREPLNPHDPNAIRVDNAIGLRVYVAQ